MNDPRQDPRPERPYDERRYDERLDDVRAPDWADAVAASAQSGALVPAAPAGAPAGAFEDDDDAPLAPEDVRGNLRRYARYQWRDYWQRRGFWLAGAALFGVWLLTWIAANRGGRGGPVGAAEMTALSHVLFALGGVAAGLIGAGGLVARERERGLQRFLFAKPVPIVRYYLQGLAVNGVGSLLVLLAAVLVAALVLPGVIPVATVFAGAALAYVLASGLTFLISTLLRWDAPIAAAWLAAGVPLTAAAYNGFWWAQPLRWLFPHGPAVAVFEALRPANMGDVNSVAQILTPLTGAALVGAAYGLACVAAGVAVLRRRSIQT